jgi:hypothetical protein
MKTIELTIDGVTALFTLREREAPRTSSALWEMLPLEETVRHFRYGGQAGYAIERKLRDANLPFEDRLTFFVPGTLSLKPHQGELAICYGPAQARTLAGINGNEWATRFADAAGDVGPFLEVVARTLREGKKQMTIRRHE